MQISNGMLKITFGLGLILMTLLFSVASLAKSDNPLPISGPYKVGYINTISTQADTDSNVDQIYLRIWYPVDSRIHPSTLGITHAKYDNGLLTKDFAPGVLKPVVVADQAWDGNAGNLPAATGHFPVIIATPSFSFPPGIVYGPYAEALASQGIVFALVENTHDGLRCRLNRPVCGTNAIPSLFNTSPEGRILISDTRSNDMLNGLHQLEDLNQTHPVLKKVMNLDQMGIFGYSAGGPSSLSFIAKSDFPKRFKALMLLDPVFVPQEPNNNSKMRLPTLLVSVSITGKSIRPGLTPIDPTQIFVGGYDPLTFAASCPAPILYKDVTVCLAVYSPGMRQVDLLNAPDLAASIGTPHGKITQVQLRYFSHDGFSTCNMMTNLGELRTLFNMNLVPGISNSTELTNIFNESRLPCEKLLYDGRPIEDVYGIELGDQATQSAVATQYLVAFARVYLLGDHAYQSLLNKGAAQKLGVPMFYWDSPQHYSVIGGEQ